MNTTQLLQRIDSIYTNRSKEGMKSSKIYLDSINFGKLSFHVQQVCGIVVKDDFMWKGLKVHKLQTLEEHVEIY